MLEATASNTSKLDQLRTLTTVVADTGDIESIREHRPTDATTNPTLILKASGDAHTRALLDDAIQYGRAEGRDEAGRHDAALTRVAVNFGCEILELIPGRVSTEVDARLSFDVEGSIAKARELIRLYEAAGVPRERILIKLASTWEGVQAARRLESEGIHCNMTLMFCVPQAAACAEAGATLISPFVGRITDWYRQAEGVEAYEPAEDPGVRSLQRIYSYCKKFGYATEVMGASFRTSSQVLEVAGCDLLTISPALLAELAEATGEVPRKLDPEQAAASDLERLELDEPAFRWALNADAMATEKLAEGIRRFADDAVKLERMLVERGL